MGPRLLAYRLMYLYCIVFFKKRHQEKWENAYLTDKSETASGALSRPHPPACRVMFQQTKVNEETRPLIVSDKEKENCICHMLRIFHIEIDIL